MEFRLPDLRDRAVVVTGGARGMGKAYSRAFLPEGAKAALADLSFYLADEVRGSNVAVNAVFPGHTRTTGSDEQEQAFARMGARSGTPRLVPEHVAPLVLFLAGQDARSLTGRPFDAMQWNIEHGLGGPEQWMYKV